MKFNEWINENNKAFIEFYNELDAIAESAIKEVLSDSIDESVLNEKPETNDFNPIKYVRLKSNYKKLVKAKFAERMADVEAAQFKTSKKWDEIKKDSAKKEKFDKKFEMLKKAKADEASAIEDKIDNIASTAALKRYAGFLKNKANLKSIEAAIKKGEGYISQSLSTKWKEVEKNAKKSDVTLGDAIESDVKQAEEDLKRKETSKGETSKGETSKGETSKGEKKTNAKKEKLEDDIIQLGDAKTKAEKQKQDIDKKIDSASKLANDKKDEIADAKKEGDTEKEKTLTKELDVDIAKELQLNGEKNNIEKMIKDYDDQIKNKSEELKKIKQ